MLNSQHPIGREIVLRKRIAGEIKSVEFLIHDSPNRFLMIIFTDCPLSVKTMMIVFIVKEYYNNELNVFIFR
ncbi:hypothetical protein BTS2_0462 [Bacillus sp. TS-2]|nr:hypothetical protein BTS2_0462 [Bacillus sp. TS-2]